MMRFLLSVFCLISSVVFSQKKKKTLDVVSNIEAKVIMMQPVGNNFLAKTMQPFYGFGFSGNLMTPINFGIGLDYNVLFTNVKAEQINVYGNLGAPRMTNIELYLTHRDKLSEDFSLEEMAGFSYYSLVTTLFDDKNYKFNDGGMGFNLGGKLLYTVDLEGYQQLFISGKVNFYYSDVYNENPGIRRFFSRSTLLSLSVGYRYNF